ncbi:MAG TPA: hypothetical protein VF144_12160 [Chitinophagaceae bacterium]
MKKIIAIAAAGIFFSACKKTNEHSDKDMLTTQEKIVIPKQTTTGARNAEVEYNTFYGPAVKYGEGHVRSWTNITHDDQPLAIGIEFTHGALTQHPEQGEETHAHHALLKLHQKAKELMPFDHITMGFMMVGHPPPGIYSVPHFDLHFYKMPLEQRLAIPEFTVAPNLFNNLPPAGYIPSGYFRAPNEGIAQMGTHFIDLLSPEFQGQPFTHTFIFGSYDGKVTFLEPMVTQAFFQSGATAHKDIRQPQSFDPINTYYPTRYNIWKNENSNRHYVALDQMVLR